VVDTGTGVPTRCASESEFGCGPGKAGAGAKSARPRLWLRSVNQLVNDPGHEIRDGQCAIGAPRNEQVGIRVAHEHRASQPDLLTGQWRTIHRTDLLNTMKITLHGAAGEVTGSAYHLQTSQASVLVDCGMFQGVAMAEDRNHVPAGLDLSRLDAVLLTHAHLDHTGRLPLLARQGYQGPVFATPATLDLTGLILRDAAKIQLTDNERINRRRERAGKPPVAPLFSLPDVESILSCAQPVAYNEPVEIARGIQARFVEAGHLLGSASIELTVNSDGQSRVVIFSGDLGPKGAPILNDYQRLKAGDLVFLESTYGDHNHRSFADTLAEFDDIVQTAAQQRGKILVPTFAVGRAQLILYCLARLFQSGAVAPFPIHLDSPMAIEATRLYEAHPELYDEEALELRRNHTSFRDMPTLHFSSTADQSRALNDLSGPCLILAGAGMCNAGRILHHLKQNLWRPETWVVIVGYQGRGSLGRQLVEGRKEVSIFGEPIAVKARVRTLGGFSAHAGQADLLNWFEPLAGAQPRVVLTHGEPGPRNVLAGLLQKRHGITALQPAMADTINL
jgi:metallo-beta-lactamase family protein